MVCVVCYTHVDVIFQMKRNEKVLKYFPDNVFQCSLGPTYWRSLTWRCDRVLLIRRTFRRGVQKPLA